MQHLITHAIVHVRCVKSIKLQRLTNQVPQFLLLIALLCIFMTWTSIENLIKLLKSQNYCKILAGRGEYSLQCASNHSWKMISWSQFRHKIRTYTKITWLLASMRNFWNLYPTLDNSSILPINIKSNINWRRPLLYILQSQVSTEASSL